MQVPGYSNTCRNMDDSSVILTNGVVEQTKEVRKSSPKKELRFSLDFADGLLSNDHEELSERVSYLEKKVRQQEDEIICLKSALADAIRRVSQVEAGRAQNSILPSKPTLRSARKTSSTSSDRRSHSNALENAHLTPNRSTTPPVSSRNISSPRTPSNTHMKKWSSLSNSAELNNTQLGPMSNKEPLWNQEEGYLKIYLRGRAVNLYAPSSIADYNVSKIANAPEEKLRLEWVYGYRGRDCRNNLYYLPTGEVIYFIAGVVILQNVEENTQRHYTGHTDDVKCIAIHPDKVKIASGQIAGHDKNSGKRKVGNVKDLKDIPAEVKDHWPHVRIWDSVSLHTLHVIGIGDFDRAVCCLSFSKLDGGQHLVVVDEANEHVISVWGFAKDKPHKITETKSSTEPVLAAEFHPLEKNSIITCGKGQISFWTLDGGTLAKKTGIFDKHEKPKYVLCLAFADNGDVISGDSNGNIFIWTRGNNRISQAITGIHDGGIFSICVMKDGTVLSGGGKDRKIVQFDTTYKPTGVEYEIPENFGGVRTLSQGQGGLLLVGATKNCILQGTIDLKLTPVVMGHTDELWGLASHPTQHQFMTSGSDRHIQLWDSMTRTIIWSKEIPEAAHSCCFHPDGNLAAVGTQSGRWLIIDLSTHEIVISHTDGSEQIECLQYSPDGNFLALGSRDNYIYVYEVTGGGQKYTRFGRCSGHSSFITHIDWSTDNKYLISNSGDYEVLYWTMPNCKQVTSSSSLREVQWATQNCTLAFNTAGIWPDGADGTDVNACCKSNKQHLLASADDFGKVKLYKYPCCQPKSNSHCYGGHSSHVTNVQFLYDDSRLISTGGRDMTIMQWECV